MYLSRIEVDLKSRGAMRAMDNPEILHGMIESCFSEDHERTLWRMDTLNEKKYLLLLSREKPDLIPLDRQIGMPGSSLETKDYQPLLDRIKAGSIWHFRLVANPVKSVMEPGEKRGSLKAITIASQQREWLERQSGKHGFLLAPKMYDVVQSEWRNFRNKGRNVSILSVSFEGILTVSDEAAFLKMMQNGLGRGKAYGMGLMTVVSHE